MIFCAILAGCAWAFQWDCFLQNVDFFTSTGLPYGSWLKDSPIKRFIRNAMEDYCDRVSNLSQIFSRSLLGPSPSFFSDRIPSTTSSAPFGVTNSTCVHSDSVQPHIAKSNSFWKRRV
ncbi:hypothetical protein J1N35_029116, partial [Gossypium stocksii]